VRFFLGLWEDAECVECGHGIHVRYRMGAESRGY
jgi:hypothetical protein